MGDFPLLAALLGGMLIGAAAFLLMAANGRIMGMSGIMAGVLAEAGAERGWRLAFLAGVALPGVVMGAGGWLHLQGNGLGAGLLAISGFLVGIGTRMGSGCTSGHGICGLARFSPRSLAAVVTFMAVAAVTVFVRRHVMGA